MKFQNVVLSHLSLSSDVTDGVRVRGGVGVGVDGLKSTGMACR